MSLSSDEEGYLVGGMDLMIFAAWLGVFVYGYLNAMLGIVLPDLRAKLSLNESQAGRFFLLNSIGLLIASIPAGLVMDAIGTKQILCFGLFLIAVAFWTLSLINRSKYLYVAAFVMGLGGAMVIAGENTAISLVQGNNGAIASNLLNLFFGVGAFVAPFIVMPLLVRKGFSGVLRVSAILTACILVLHLAIHFPVPQVAGTISFERVAFLVRQPHLLLLTLLVFLYVGTEFSVWSWTVTFLTTERGYSTKSASRIISLFALSMIAGRWATQWTLTFFGAERLLMLSAASSVISLGLLYLVRNRIIISLAAITGGWSMAAIFPTALGLAGTYYAQSVGTAISLTTTGGWLGAIAIPPAVGFLANRFGVRRAVLVPIGAALLMIIPPLALSALH